MSPVDARLQQRAGDGHLGGRHRPVIAARRADSHQRGARARHHGLHVREVQVDKARGGDQVGDSLHTGEQHLVGCLERLEHADLAVGDGQQPVVRDHDERVHLAAQPLDAQFGLGRAALAFETERAGDHADRERAERPGHVRDHRCPPRARPAALARGDEDHVGALEHLLDLLAVIFRRTAADLGVGARAQTAGELPPDVELDVRVAHEQRLRVRVDRDELNALEPLFDHPVHGIDAAPSDTDDLDDRQIVLRCCHEEGPFRSFASIASQPTAWTAGASARPGIRPCQQLADVRPHSIGRAFRAISSESKTLTLNLRFSVVLGWRLIGTVGSPRIRVNSPRVNLARCFAALVRPMILRS